ncbi:MAG: OmpA family protein [Chromatiales bacterium]|jgi:chemotaxis protein MotB
MRASPAVNKKQLASLNRAGNRLQQILLLKPARNDPQSWLIVYLDIITLLLAMFILLVNQPQQQFQVEKPQIQTTEIQPKPVEQAKPTLNQQLADQLLRSLDFIDGREVKIEVEAGQVNLQLPEAILFETGKSTLLEEASALLARIVPVLQQNDYPISVEGHTDNVPIESQLFPSNWELSTARASVVIRKLVQLGIPMSRLKAVGYADTRPLQSNATAAGRKANRRVKLVIHANEAQQP